MYPILLQYNGFYFSSWHVFYLLASLAAWALLHKLRISVMSQQLSAQRLDTIFITGYISGYFGSRIGSIVLEKEYLNQNFSLFEAIFHLGSMTLYGGVLAVVCVLAVFIKIDRLSLFGLAELFVPAALLAIGIGRIGCFLNGDDYGSQLTEQVLVPWWAVSFQNLGDGLYRYPVQLMEVGLCWGLLASMFLAVRLSSRRQSIAADLGVIGYALGRIALEFFRGDDRGVLFSDILSPAQWISIGILLAWLGFRLRLHLRKRNILSDKAQALTSVS